MQKSFFHFFIVCMCIVPHANGQQTDSLYSIKGDAANIYFSAGHEQRANDIARRVEMALSWYQELLAYKPMVTLLVLSSSDWSRYTSMGAVYGMPHYDPKKKILFVAAEDNPFWKSFLPPLDQLPAALREQVQTVYRNPAGELSMQAFFDLLAIHELGHAFHNQNNLNMQRKWMGELFVNILLHTYIAENEPALLPSLTVFPRMVVAGGSGEFKFTSLLDIEERYDEIARDYPKNYGWYQCRWHSAAARIYDAAGKQVCKKLWVALNGEKDKLTDQQLISFLEVKADQSLANVLEKWDAGY